MQMVALPPFHLHFACTNTHAVRAFFVMLARRLIWIREDNAKNVGR